MKLEFISGGRMDTEIQRGGGQAVDYVFRILWREGQDRNQEVVCQMVEERRRTCEEPGPEPAPLRTSILQDDGSKNAGRFHEDGVRAQLGTAHPRWGPVVQLRVDGMVTRVLAPSRPPMSFQ